MAPKPKADPALLLRRERAQARCEILWRRLGRTFRALDKEYKRLQRYDRQVAVQTAPAPHAAAPTPEGRVQS